MFQVGADPACRDSVPDTFAPLLVLDESKWEASFRAKEPDRAMARLHQCKPLLLASQKDPPKVVANWRNCWSWEDTSNSPLPGPPAVPNDMNILVPCAPLKLSWTWVKTSTTLVTACVSSLSCNSQFPTTLSGPSLCNACEPSHTQAARNGTTRIRSCGVVLSLISLESERLQLVSSISLPAPWLLRLFTTCRDSVSGPTVAYCTNPLAVDDVEFVIR